MLPDIEDNKHNPLLLVNRIPAQAGAYNMALDQLIFESTFIVTRSVWRLYGWMPAAVSIGRNQKIGEAVNWACALEAGIEIVRRPTGGRAIWHSGDVCFTYAGVTPESVEPVSASKHDYVKAAEAAVRFLNRLGIGAEISRGLVRAAGFGGSIKAPCFQSPGRYEIMVGARKIAGIAQYRSAGRFLIQGSIRVSAIDPLCRRLFFDQGDRGAEAFGRLGDSVTSIEEELGKGVGWARLVRSFGEGIGVSQSTLAESAFPEIGITSDRLLDLQESRYGNSSWNERF